MQRSERDGERQGRDGPAAARTGGGDDGGVLRLTHEAWKV